jgi:hypothetical protein
MQGDASLARLLHDYAGRWEIERIERGAEWVAVLRGSQPVIHIIGARDLGALRYRSISADSRQAVSWQMNPGPPCA